MENAQNNIDNKMKEINNEITQKNTEKETKQEKQQEKREKEQEKEEKEEENKDKDKEEEEEERGEFAIAGGGIAGLALALRLQQEGRKVHIYERDLSFNYLEKNRSKKRRGFGITIYGQGTRSLKDLDLFPLIRLFPIRIKSFDVFSVDNFSLISSHPFKVFFF